MPQYIPQVNTAMMQAFIEAQRRKDLRPEQTKRDVGNAITDAISKVVGQHYKNKEMKLMQNKADKEKEFNGLIDYLQKNEILKLPAGTTEETKVEGYTQIPSEMQQRLQGQGITAQYSQPREKPIKAEPVIGAAGRKAILAQTGKDLSEDTPIRLAQNLIKPEPLPKEKIAPPGFRYVGDNLEAIPGGPAALKAEEKKEKKGEATATEIFRAENVIATVDKALSKVGYFTSGLLGGTMKMIGGTKAADLEGLVKTVQANLGFDRLTQMRAESPTGGALGQVSNIELELLTSAVTNLSQHQSPTQLRENLNAVKTHLSNWTMIKKKADSEGKPKAQPKGEVKPKININNASADDILKAAEGK